MMIAQTIKSITQYLTEGFLRIFSPMEDRYPVIGVQPFEGDIYSSKTYFDY